MSIFRLQAFSRRDLGNLSLSGATKRKLRTFTSSSSPSLPDSAEIVIVGGGAIGCACAYTLANAGKKNIVVLEKEAALSSVTSAQAAGLVGQVRTDVDRVRLAMWSVATFTELQKNEEVNPNWRQVGSLRIAETPERVEEFKLMEKVCRQAGLEMGFISVSEAKKKWPEMAFENAKAILWCPSDGYLQPYDLAMTYRWHARQKGVRFLTNHSLESIEVSPKNQIQAVITDKGRIKCEMVVNAAGANAYQVAKLVGMELPLVPVRHEYFISEPLGKEKIQPHMPVLRIPDRTLYVRADVNSILVGGWEPKALSLDPRNYQHKDKMPPIEEDWTVLSHFAELLSKGFYPAINTVGIRHVFSGWPTFTPDGKFIIGRSKRVGGFIMAGGCNAHGVSGSAGIGKYVAESILEPVPSDYVRSLSPDRFLDHPWTWDNAQKNARNIYETYYGLKH